MKNIIFLLLFTACVSEKEIRGQLYINEGIPKELCDKYPEIKEFGVYRVISETEEELLPYCSNRIKKFLSADRVYVEEWLKQATRPQ